MRAVIQRVSRARVTIPENGELAGQIGRGILVLLGISGDDTEKEADYILQKTLHLRIFEDDDGRMNRSLFEIGGELLVVSQFTLYGDARKGRRPSFMRAAQPAEADRLYRYFLDRAAEQVGRVASGRFQAMMDVELVNDGPVTILLDSEKNF